MKEKWQSIRGFFRKNSRKLIPLLLLAAILLPIVVDNSYVLGICTKILLYMLLASSVNVINGYSGQFAIGHAGFLCVGAYTAAILMVLSCHAGCRGDDLPVRDAGFLSHR